MSRYTEDELAALHRVFEAARRGDVDELRPLLEAGFTPNLTNDRGDTLLILAAYHCHPECVRLLVAHGADHGRVNDQGQTALGCAVFRQRPEIVADLLAAGADPNAGIRSARDVAAFFGLEEMAALLPA